MTTADATKALRDSPVQGLWRLPIQYVTGGEYRM